jgi:energy-coupling factor transport system ATP-binding protein
MSPQTAYDGALVSAHQVGVTLTSSRASRRRVTTQALAPVDATLVAGEALAVTGPSGSGKSTLLSVLAGLQRPTSGELVTADHLAPRPGTAPWRWSSRELAARIAWTPQLPEVGMVAARVRDEVAATGRAVGRDQAWLERRVDGLLDLFGLSHLADANPHQLSGGEQRRLMLAAALAHGPAVATFDEPTVGQDRLTWAVVVAALSGARAAGTAIGLATHDGEAATAVSSVELALRSTAREPS